MISPAPAFIEKLHACCKREFGAAPKSLTRLVGGANCEMWVFEIDKTRYVLRKSVTDTTQPTSNLTMRSQRAEAQLLVHIAKHAPAVPVPRVQYITSETDGLGDGFIMEHVAGETIARKILRDDIFATQRPQLGAQCGTLLAHVHACPLPDGLLEPVSARDSMKLYRERLAEHAHPHPVFELAFSWLDANCPPSKPAQLVHGDFRNGNLMITPAQGIVSVLDWELAYIGDGMADLGWLCVPSWRFGMLDKPVGGFGERNALFDAYEAAGGTLDKAAIRFWEIFGALKWGIMCTGMGDASVTLGYAMERAAIGRRASETELDLLYYLEEAIHAG